MRLINTINNYLWGSKNCGITTEVGTLPAGRTGLFHSSNPTSRFIRCMRNYIYYYYTVRLQELEKRSKDVSPVRGEVGITPKNIHDHRFGSEASGSSTASSHRASKGRLQHVSHGIK